MEKKGKEKKKRNGAWLGANTRWLPEPLTLLHGGPARRLAEPYTAADMVTPKEKPPQSRSCSPRDTESQLGRNIPEIFRTQLRKATALTQASTGTCSSSLSPSNRRSTQCNAGSPATHPLNTTDLKSVAADIKDTLAAAITDLSRDIHVWIQFMSG